MAVTSHARAVLLAALLSAVTTVVAVVVLTPWRSNDVGDGAGATPQSDSSRLIAEAFSTSEIARAAAFRADLGPWPYLGLVAALLVPWAAFLVCRRRRDPPGVRCVSPGRRGATTAATVLAVLAIQWAVGLPFAAHGEGVMRDYGLSTRSWPAWWRDQAVAWILTAAVTTASVLAIGWTIRKAPRRWPWLLAIGAATFVAAASLLYPVVVERAFNTFRPLPASALTERVEQVARRSGYPDVRIVVSDASIRTTRENAHVSGLGATRWVVLDDTLLRRAEHDPGAVLAVVAHEFGHVANRDVLRGTAVGALAAVAAVLTLAGLSLRRGLRPSWTDPATDRWHRASGVCLLVAIIGTAPYAVAPGLNVVSRRVEARADVAALQLTGDAPAFVRMQHDLAVRNLSRLEPVWWHTTFFATHPDPARRIATARAWQHARAR